jgi:cell division protein FtsB
LLTLLTLLLLLLQEYIMNKLQKQLEKLAGEKATLQRERTDLQRQTSELSAAVDKLNRDKVRLLLKSIAVLAGQSIECGPSSVPA